MPFRPVHVLYLDGTILDFHVSLAVAPVPLMLYKIPAKNKYYSFHRMGGAIIKWGTTYRTS